MEIPSWGKDMDAGCVPHGEESGLGFSVKAWAPLKSNSMQVTSTFSSGISHVHVLLSRAILVLIQALVALVITLIILHGSNERPRKVKNGAVI